MKDKMPARNLETGGSAENVLEEDLSFLVPTINMGRKRLHGSLGADLVDSLRTAAAPFTVASPRSNDSFDVDSDDELLMDVEVRTSGPDSGLITNKSELKDDDENDHVLNLSQNGNILHIDNTEHDLRTDDTKHVLRTDDTKHVQNDTDVDLNKRSTEEVYPVNKLPQYPRKGLTADTKPSIGKSNGHANSSNENITTSPTEFGVPVTKFIGTPVSSLNTTFTETTDGLHKQPTIPATTPSPSNRNDFSVPNDESRETIQSDCYEIKDTKRHSQQCKTVFDNSYVTNLIESAFEVVTDKCAISETKSNSLMSANGDIKRNCGTNAYYARNFPKLKQMLTSGNISEATQQFSKVMSIDSPNSPKLNHLDTSGIENDKLGCTTNEKEVSNHIVIAQGVKEDKRPCLKRPLADGCDTVPNEYVYLPPKMSKRAFETIEGLQYQNGRINSVRAKDSRDGQKGENNQADTTYKPVPCQNSGLGKGDTPACGPRPSSQRVPPPAPLLPPCRVCGEKASGFHYGVNTCEACKGFFRRSLCRKEPYVCVSDGTCEVQSGRRTVCSHCRLKRCLDVGMSKNAIKTGRYTHELRSRNIMEVKQLQKLRERGTTVPVPEPVLPQIKVPDSTIKPAVPCSPELNAKLQNDLDKLMVAQTYLFEFLDDYYDADLILKRQMEVYNRYKKEKFDRLRKNKANNLTLNVERQYPPNNCMSRDYTDEVIPNYAPAAPIKEQVLATTIEDMERGIQGLVMFAKNIPGFVDLHVDDQAALLKVSRFDIWYIGHIRCMNSPLRVGACEWYFHAEELEQVWGTKVVDMLFKLTDYGQKLDLTREETVALRALSLTFSDRCVLKDRKAVDNIHDKQFQIFQYVASKRHPDFYKWLPDVINFLTYLREFAIEFDKKSCNMNMEWPVIQRNPLLLEVFFS